MHLHVHRRLMLTTYNVPVISLMKQKYNSITKFSNYKDDIIDPIYSTNNTIEVFAFSFQATANKPPHATTDLLLTRSWLPATGVEYERLSTE